MAGQQNCSINKTGLSFFFWPGDGVSHPYFTDDKGSSLGSKRGLAAKSFIYLSCEVPSIVATVARQLPATYRTA